MVEIYVIDVRVPKEDSRRYEVHQSLTLGSDSSCDIRVRDHGIPPLQGRFRLQNDVLTYTNLGPEDSCKVGSTKCGHGRMYILDKGDKCTTGDIKLIVRKEKVEITYKDEANLDELNDDEEEEEATSPSIGLGNSEETHASTIDDISKEATASIKEINAVPQSQEQSEEDEGEEDFEYVEETVYVDEDGNEVAAPKKHGFFTKLREKFKRKEKEELKQPPKSPHFGKGKGLKKPRKLIPPTAGLLPRFFGFTYNLLLFGFVYKMGLPILKTKLQIDIPKILGTALKEISPLITKIPEKIPGVPQLTPHVITLKSFLSNAEYQELFLIFIGYELIFHLIFGVGLGQFFLGLKATGNFLLIRLLSPLRVIVGYLTLPLLIFDIPILFKKASLKEVVGKARIQLRSPVLMIFNALVLVPILIFTAANYQLIPSIIDRPPKVTSAEKTVGKPKATFKDIEFNFESKNLELSVKTFTNPKMRFIPGLIANKNTLAPKLIAINIAKQKFVEVNKLDQEIPLVELVNILKKDPLLKFLKPDLYDFKESSKVALNYDPILEGLFEIISLDVTNPIRAFRKIGVFLGPYLEIRDVLLKSIKKTAPQQTTLIRTPTATLLKLSYSGAVREDYLFRISNQKLIAYKFSYDKSSGTVPQKVEETLFYGAKNLESPYKVVLGKALKNNDIKSRGFAVLDIFEHILNKQKVNNAERKIITDLFLATSKESLQSESETYQQIIIDNIKTMDKLLLKLKARNKDDNLGEIRLNLIRIQDALFKRDEKFFKLN